MFEDLRKSASEGYEEYKEDPLEDFNPYDSGENQKAGVRGFLGMTASQRFILSVMLLAMSCILAGFALVLTEKVYLPFF